MSDINKEVNVLGKEIFEIKILVNENKDADDKNQASVNKKLQDIFSAKGNVNDQLNNLLYMLTNAEVLNLIIPIISKLRYIFFEVAIEENNRNTLTQLSKFKKVQSQISEDFTKQFSILEKLLDEFTTGKWKSPLIASVKILTFLLSKNKTFKKEENICTLMLLIIPFFPPDTKKSIVAERKALDTNCRDNNDEFKVQNTNTKHKTNTHKHKLPGQQQ